MRKRFLFVAVLLLVLSVSVAAQIHVPQDQRGDRRNRKEGVHNGNLVETLFYNFGEVAWYGREPSGVWPKGSTHSYMDGITPLVAAEVTDGAGNTIHMVEAGYRENMDISPTGVERGWQPRPNFANPNQDLIAMSDKPITWPAAWPDKDDTWNGFWNGYFGKRTNADQESYFVMDDNSDDGSNFLPDSTDETRRGLGTSVGVRGFQWANLLAEDLVFWHYEITNEGTTQYNKMIFGMYVDCGVGGQFDSNDDYAFYNKPLNTTFSWDHDKIGQGGWTPTGYAGYAFLESPGNPFNKIDDDYDGEDGSPTVTSQMLIGEIPGNGIDDNGNGLIDEAQINVGLDGNPAMMYADGVDNNNNGIIDEMIDESRDNGKDDNASWNSSTDDVGLDGISGTGDFGEGDGLPTSGWQPVGIVPGAPTSPVNRFGLVDTRYPGEPGIDKTDINESDQIGLTAFDVFYIGAGVLFRDDDRIWERISYNHFESGLQNGNIAFLFGSGPFILPSAVTERFSLGLLFGSDLPDILRNKEVVQDIYDNNYNFARPPAKPEITVVPGDGKVTLYWDSKAEESFDDFTQTYDFEGYKIYRSTDPGFLDAYTITSGYGDKTLFKPIAQFDYVNDVKDFFDLDYQGVKIFMGENKGLQHSFVDTDVINGQHYYYAVVSYDRGDAAIGLYPSECTKVIVRDLAGNITTDVNTQSVTPGPEAAGYVNAALKDSILHIQGFGSGDVAVSILDRDLVQEKEYLVTFNDTANVDTTYYSLYEVNGAVNTPVFENSLYTSGEDFNPLFDGIRLSVTDDPIEFDTDNSKWKNGTSNLLIQGEKTDAQVPLTARDYPVSYEIRMGEPDSSWRFVPRAKTLFSVYDSYNNQKVKFFLYGTAPDDSVLSENDVISIWYKIGTAWKEIWKFKFIPTPNEDVKLPDNGDVAICKIKTPFTTTDQFRFYTVPQSVDNTLAKNQLDDIFVVPNPYVGAARWEPQRLTASGRGDRLIYFMNVPAGSVIRIYTISGDHVQTLTHDGSITDGKVPWNLMSKSGMDIAPGVYIYHVDAPGVGEKIDRFAIIK